MMNTIKLIILSILIFSCTEKNSITVFDNENEIVKAKTNYLLAEIQHKYLVNPIKVDRIYNATLSLNKRFDSLLKSIESKNAEKLLKTNNELNDELKSNELFQSKYLKSIVFKNRLQKWSSIQDVTLALEQNEQLLLNFNSLKFELTAHLNDLIDADDSRLNRLSALVVDSPKKLKVGDEYSANIYLTAVDSTILPIIKIADLSVSNSEILSSKPNNKRVKVIDYFNSGNYQMKINRTGQYGYKGVILVPNDKGEIKKVWFKREFMVK